jgi:hypothetical protein
MSLMTQLVNRGFPTQIAPTTVPAPDHSQSEHPTPSTHTIFHQTTMTPYPYKTHRTGSTNYALSNVQQQSTTLSATSNNPPHSQHWPSPRILSRREGQRTPEKEMDLFTLQQIWPKVLVPVCQPAQTPFSSSPGTKSPRIAKSPTAASAAAFAHKS